MLKKVTVQLRYHSMTIDSVSRHEVSFRQQEEKKTHKKHVFPADKKKICVIVMMLSSSMYACMLCF